jgi:pimeloyl-ACP methyl ester carboxylesterase
MFSIFKKFILILILVCVLGYQVLTLFGVFPFSGDRMTNQTKGRLVTVGGEVLRVYNGDDNGPDVLLIHGCPGMIEDWDWLIGKLFWGFHVVAYDRPGYGASKGVNIPYNMKHNADVALALMDQMGMKDAVVVGHSYGAEIALNMALREPERVKSFVLAGSSAYDVDGIPSECEKIGWPVIGNVVAVYYWLNGGKEFIKKTLTGLFSPEKDTIGFINKRAKLWSKPRILISSSRELLQFNEGLEPMISEYKNIKKSVYIVSGEFDPWIKQARKLHANMPGSKFTEIPNAGHYITVTQREAIADIIEEASIFQQP